MIYREIKATPLPYDFQLNTPASINSEFENNRIFCLQKKLTHTHTHHPFGGRKFENGNKSKRKSKRFL